MRFFFTCAAWLGTVCLALALRPGVGAAPISADAKAKAEAPAEKTRRLLDQTVNVEFVDQTLQAVLDQLSEQTKVKFIIDRVALGQVSGDDPDLPVRVKLQDVKLRSAVRSILVQYGLTFVINDDTVIVTTEEAAFHRQLRQRVQVSLDDTPLATALKNMGRTSAVNLVLDPRVPKPAREVKVTLDLEEVPLETAVFLIAEMAELKSVRVGNVLFVTTGERADKLRNDPEVAGMNDIGGDRTNDIGNDPDLPGVRVRILPNGRRIIEQVRPGRARIEMAIPGVFPVPPPAPPQAVPAPAPVEKN